jgi:hypothetical protein
LCFVSWVFAPVRRLPYWTKKVVHPQYVFVDAPLQPGAVPATDYGVGICRPGIVLVARRAFVNADTFQPRTAWISARRRCHALSSDRSGLQGAGWTSSPVCGRLVVWMANGTTCRRRARSLPCQGRPQPGSSINRL